MSLCLGSAISSVPWGGHPRSLTDSEGVAMDEHFEVKGKSGRMIVSPTKVVIKLTGSLRGPKEILIDQITAIHLKPAGVTSGHIEFSYAGSGYRPSSSWLSNLNEGNTVYFNKKQQPEFEKAKTLIENYRLDARAVGSGPSAMDELEKLASLRDRGIVSPEEFEAKKKALLGL